MVIQLKDEFGSAEYAPILAHLCAQLSARICQLHAFYGMQLTFLYKKTKEYGGLSDICSNFAANYK